MHGSNHNSTRLSSAGFSLFELLVVMALLGALLSVSAVYLTRGRQRLRQATNRAIVRNEFAMAADRLRSDIRSATGVSRKKLLLTLRRADGSTIVWQFTQGQMSRLADGSQKEFQGKWRELRIEVTRHKSGKPFVELALALDHPGNAVQDVIYVGASVRGREGSHEK